MVNVVEHRARWVEDGEYEIWEQGRYPVYLHLLGSCFSKAGLTEEVRLGPPWSRLTPRPQSR